ncbi:MAG: CoA-transferase [Armatimonadota bacterium]|nr:CoA-transferase [Armatimonadota bacterium]MDR7469499.1 CoA-transferase [Armatimonadota bacterium]MDR7475450.1 CoA-transferase [Armatimonadota bacterium]
MSLSEAVRRFVRPGMALHFGGCWAFPFAALFEVTRQFWGRDPGFTYIAATGTAVTLAPLLLGTLVRRVISTFNGDGLPFPAPNPVIQRAYREGGVIFEDWTMLTYTLRLMAGALGLPFLPTRSMAGSDLSTENHRAFAVLTDPFGSNEEVGVVRALRPDLSFVHGWAADELGNVVLGSPLGGGAWGALAAKEGVIVTVERLVDTDCIRRHARLVHIPGDIVRAVCVVPFGAHPGGHLGCIEQPSGEYGVCGLCDPDGAPWPGYAEDEAFILEARAASQDPISFRRWVEQWILGLEDHKGYLARLGEKRLIDLYDRLRYDYLHTRLLARQRSEEGFTDDEVMIIGAAQELERLILRRGFRRVLAGIGASHLAAWLAAERLREAGYSFSLLAEVGLYDYRPFRGDPYVFSLRNAPTAALSTDLATLMGALMGAPGARCLGVIGAGEVDRWGNVNTSKVPQEKLYMVGSGGGNDVASLAEEVVVVARQSTRRFVERVSFITSPGTRVRTVISQRGVYRKMEPSGELVLVGVFAPGEDVRAAIQVAREECDWELRVADRVEQLPPPDAGMLDRLRGFDPVGYYRRSRSQEVA